MTRSLLFAAALCVLTLACTACHKAPTEPLDPAKRLCLAYAPPETVAVEGAPPGTVAILRRCLLLGR